MRSLLSMTPFNDDYAPPDPYAAGLQALTAALPVPSEFAREYTFQQGLQHEAEYHFGGLDDARAAEAAARLGCAVHELRMVVDDDHTYTPPDSLCDGARGVAEEGGAAAMTTTTIDDRIATLLPQLKAHYAALGDGRDRLSDDEKARWWTARVECQQCISVLQSAGDLDPPTRRLAECEEKRTATLAKQEELVTAIREAPDASSIPDARARDAERDRQAQLGRACSCSTRVGSCVRRAMSMVASAVWTSASAELQQRIVRIRAALEAAVRQAEAL